MVTRCTGAGRHVRAPGKGARQAGGRLRGAHLMSHPKEDIMLVRLDSAALIRMCADRRWVCFDA